MERVTFRAHTDPLVNAVGQLRDLLEKPLDVPREIVDQLLSLASDFSPAFELDSATTGRTVVVTFKPSKLLCDLVSAVRALD